MAIARIWSPFWTPASSAHGRPIRYGFDDRLGAGRTADSLPCSEFGRPRERCAQRNFFEQPGENKRDDRHHHPPEENAVQGVCEGLQELAVHPSRELVGLLRCEVDAPGEMLCRAGRQVLDLSGEPRGENRAENRHAEGAADGTEECCGGSG